MCQVSRLDYLYGVQDGMISAARTVAQLADTQCAGDEEMREVLTVIAASILDIAENEIAPELAE